MAARIHKNLKRNRCQMNRDIQIEETSRQEVCATSVSSDRQGEWPTLSQCYPL